MRRAAGVVLLEVLSVASLPSFLFFLLPEKQCASRTSVVDDVLSFCCSHAAALDLAMLALVLTITTSIVFVCLSPARHFMDSSYSM